MTNEAPETIWSKPKFDSWGVYGHWYQDGKGGGTEYIRKDAHDAAIAAAYEDAAQTCYNEVWPEDGTYAPHEKALESAERGTVEVCMSDIRLRTPDHAKAALEALIAEAVEAERERCAGLSFEIAVIMEIHAALGTKTEAKAKGIAAAIRKGDTE